MTMFLDWERAIANADGSEELLTELAGVFIENCPDMLRQIRAAIVESNAAELERAAHNFRGSARIFAAGPATEAALRLEIMGAEADFSKANEGWIALSGEVDRLMTALADKIGRRSAGEKAT